MFLSYYQSKADRSKATTHGTPQIGWAVLVSPTEVSINETVSATKRVTFVNAVTWATEGAGKLLLLLLPPPPLLLLGTTVGTGEIVTLRPC